MLKVRHPSLRWERQDFNPLRYSRCLPTMLYYARSFNQYSFRYLFLRHKEVIQGETLLSFAICFWGMPLGVLYSWYDSPLHSHRREPASPGLMCFSNAECTQKLCYLVSFSFLFFGKRGSVYRPGWPQTNHPLPSACWTPDCKPASPCSALSRFSFVLFYLGFGFLRQGLILLSKMAQNTELRQALNSWYSHSVSVSSILGLRVWNTAACCLVYNTIFIFLVLVKGLILHGLLRVNCREEMTSVS